MGFRSILRNRRKPSTELSKVRRFETLEPRLVLTTTPLITEFMASNDNTLLDGDGNSSDWIELHNPTAAPIDLAEWHLTDDATNLGKWAFPDLQQSILEPGEYLVVFASGQLTDDYVDPGGNLHTNFRLSANGEYLALTDNNETVIQEFSPEYPPQVTDISYGIGQAGTTLLAPGSDVSYLVPTDDSLGTTWTGTSFDDSLWTKEFTPPASTFVITELALGSPDAIEIQNVGSQAVDTTGWVVVFSDSSGSASINNTESFVWDISGNHAANTILDATEFTNGLGNISWDDDAPGWAMILDDAGEAIDFVAWGYTASEIGTFNVTANGFNVTSADLPWTGNGVALVDNVFQILREGNQDNDDASDFVFSSSSSQGAQNPNLVTPFAGSSAVPATTGIGFQTFDPQLGNDGIGSAGLTVDNDVPPGAAAGTQSYDTSSGLINTQAIDLLNNALIAAAGGFTYDVWVKTSVNPPARGKIIDYAGTENLRINSSGVVEFTVSDGGATLNNGASITDGEWHHLIAEFDNNGNSVQPNGSISGTMRLSVDGNQFSQSATVSDFGDSLDRSTGVGAHPVFGSEFFPGLVHDAKVSLGVASGTLTPVFRYLAPASGSGTEIKDISAQASFAPSLIETDVESDMHGQNASLYSRQSFDVDDPASVASLTLHMQYDDGFIAYLNGTQVASSNAPLSPDFDSSATAARAGVEANSPEEFDISQHVGLLQTGENILAVHGLNINANDEDFLILPELTATLGGEASLQFFLNPTPGAANNEGGFGFVADTRFSIDRGFFDAPFQLAITTATEDAAIYYTTDGSEPSSMNGVLYEGEITIDQTTTLRARAFKEGFEPTNIDTQTYLFLDDILLQSPDGQSPAGWPAGSVNGQVFDYGIDPNIVNDPTWSPQLTTAFTQIPSLSLVTDIDNLTDPATGIYVNAQQDGPAWERPTSLELINPDGSPGFQVEAGLRIRGGFSRGDFNPKHSFRLFFRSEYGDAKLNFPLFGEEGVDRFDNVDLRTAQNYAWSNSTFNDETRNTFLRDIFSRDLQGAQGQTAYTRGEYYHLYLNGQYWGMFQTEERPNANFAESYFGGSDEDYDAVKASGGISATDGDLAAWTTLTNLANAGFTTDEAYYFVQGKNSDGTDNPVLEKHVDVDNLIDFMINVYYTGNEDMPTNLGNSGPNNFWAVRPRDGSFGWQWIAHDNEHNLGVRNHNVSVDVTSPTSAGGSPSSFNPKFLHQQLTEHPEYVQRFADRVQALFFNDGPMTVGRAQALLDSRAAEIDSAIIAESARWGDQHNEPPLTKTTWDTEVDWLRNTFLAQRTNIVLDQFRNRGWFADSSLDAPSFSQHGGFLPPGQSLSIQNAEAEGSIFYTLDGTDPRLPGGAISGDAIEYSGAFTLPNHATVTARLLREGDWSAKIQADFVLADAAADASNLRVTELNYNPVGPDATELGLGFTDGDQFEFVELLNTSSDTLSLDGVTFAQTVVNNNFEGIAFEFGLQSLDPGERVVLVKDLPAFEARYGGGINIAGTYTGNLSNAGETLTLRDASGQSIQQFSFEDGDDLGEEDWPTEPDGTGPTLVVIDTEGDYNDGTNWTASATNNGTPGTDETAPPSIPGDYDGNGTVEQADYDLWRSTFGSTVDLRADGNEDNVVDAADYVLWRNNLGRTAPALQFTLSSSASLTVNWPLALEVELPTLDEAYTEFEDSGTTVALPQQQLPLTSPESTLRQQFNDLVFNDETGEQNNIKDFDDDSLAHELLAR